MTTGERIKARRKELSISADALAAKIGVSRSTVFRWEKGEIEKVPAVELNTIAQVLQTTVEYLIGWSDNPNAVTPDHPPRPDQLSEKRREFLAFLEQVPDEKIPLLSSIIQSILEDARKGS